MLIWDESLSFCSNCFSELRLLFLICSTFESCFSFWTFSPWKNVSCTITSSSFLKLLYCWYWFWFLLENSIELCMELCDWLSSYSLFSWSQERYWSYTICYINWSFSCFFFIISLLSLMLYYLDRAMKHCDMRHITTIINMLALTTSMLHGTSFWINYSKVLPLYFEVEVCSL